VTKNCNISLAAYRRKCEGVPPRETLLDEWVQRLTDLGFEWSNKGPGVILDNLSEVKEDFDALEDSNT